MTGLCGTYGIVLSLRLSEIDSNCPIVDEKIIPSWEICKPRGHDMIQSLQKASGLGLSAAKPRESKLLFSNDHGNDHYFAYC